MGHREGCRAGVQAVPQPNQRRGKGQAGQPGLGLAPNHTGAS